MIAKDLKAILSVLKDDSEIYLEFQEVNRNKQGRFTSLNSVEVEECLGSITLKGLFTKAGDSNA
jgi:hypothetical protein